jgi:hypothetical protein
MYTRFLSASALARTGSWGASGLALMTRAPRHSGVDASRSAARSAPTKFGMRPSTPGNRAAPAARNAAHTRSRSSCFPVAARSSRPAAITAIMHRRPDSPGHL